MSVTNALLNFLLVSIPEEVFLVAISLIFLKRFDLLDVRMWKQNLKWIMIPVIPVALMINVFRYIVVIPRPMMSLSSFLVMLCLMIYIVTKNSFSVNTKLIFKIIIFTTLSFIIVGLIEILYYPLSLSLLHKSMDFFDNNILYNFLISLPARVIEICILIFVIVKKNNEVQVNLFETIVKNRFFTNSFITIIISVILAIIYITKLMMINDILGDLSILNQIIIVLIIICSPIILVTWFLLFVNYLLMKEKSIRQTYESLLEDNVDADVED